MPLIKKDFEVSLLIKSGAILAEVKQIIYDLVRPGVSLKELDTIAFGEIEDRGAKPAFLNYHGFPATICASVNATLIHGIPDEYVIKDGDVVSIDLGVVYQGYYSDSAFTKAVGFATEDDYKIIDVAEKAFAAGLAAIQPGAYLNDISIAIGKVISDAGLYTTDNFCGHGIGTALHEDPNIFNFSTGKRGPKLQDNMVLCIEPMILQGSKKVKILPDQWSVVAANGKNTAHFEQMVLIKNGRGIVLTGEIKK